MHKARKNYILKSIEATGLSFCRETSIHGCRFLVEEIDKTGNTYVRRFRRAASILVWVPAVTFGSAFAIYLMILVWNRYQTTPTITTIETNNYPIWNVPFPGVTICNVNSVYEPNTHNISLELLKRGFTPAGIESFFQSLAALVNFREVDSAFGRIFQALEDLGYSMEKLMFDMAQPCENLIRECVWLGKTVPCKSLFRLVKSARGFCCSFNYKALRSSLEIETKADDYFQINTPVIRISGAGEDVGLILLVNVEEEYYVAPKRQFYGTEIIIHDAEDFPEQTLISAYGQPGDEVSIAVVPSVVVTEESAENLPTSLRFCRFSNEKPLRITKKYSFQSCLTECRADSILKRCGCLPFFFPELSYNQSMRSRQCSLKDIKCLSDNKHYFNSLQPSGDIGYDFNNTNLNISDSSVGMSCDCLPSCSEQVYNIQTFITKLFNDTSADYGHFDTYNSSANSTIIKVYFKDLSCIKYRREIFMTWDDMLASFGGIFGLCLGGSVLSLVEIAYYATFKLYARILANKAKLEEEQNHPHLLLNFNKVRFSPVSRQKKSKSPYQEAFLW
ncbi:unnamed protein product [Hermetia illucens]|uniref:Sodium channel protein Nach n=2 Tax=Hermetia illucens TaxID=343691 RepID=A0A7R8UJA3_HERIL|nr:unnamed protein product [Hermetia illucens]